VPVATLNTLLRDVLGVKMAGMLEKSLDLVTVGDLLRHYPRRYTERGELTDLADLVEGDEVTVQAEIASATVKRIPGRKLNILEVTIVSGGSKASLSFFNQQWREKELIPGRRGLFAGKVTRFRTKLQLNSPDYMLLDGDDELLAADFAGALIPIYPVAAGARSWTVNKCVRVALDSLDDIVDPLPFEVRARVGLQDLDTALRGVHRPAAAADWRAARRRLAFDEAFGVQLVLAQRRHAMSANPAVARPRVAGGLVDAFAARLPFSFTSEQSAVAATLEAELSAEHPMHRLLQGEVGSGKTVVALRAMLQIVDAGGQAAMLAPTEVLATQHEQTILDMLGPLARAGQLGGDDQGTKVVLLTGSMPTAARRAALLDAASGAAGIVIGTHALIQDHVQFADLGLVVVDEQHRFGVEQRDALRSKASAPPHMLVMTATPIPRTVAMTVFGDLETSELRTLPAGRKEITTHVVPITERPYLLDRTWQRVREEVATGRQVYVVCPRIGEGEEVDDPGLDTDDQATQAASVIGTYSELTAHQLADLRIGLLHGRMVADDKARTMADFAAGRLDVLIATTVIEVGVNVANATAIVVLDADRFGVSQLHQLRGRIGRGQYEGLCLLLTQLPTGHPSAQRLTRVAGTRDGFDLARLDLEERREGDVLGVAQSGRKKQFKLLSLLRDEKLIMQARTEAQEVISGDPALQNHAELQEFLWDSFDSERSDFLQKS
jgi:ATP-dependent DNA helicase RecG